VKRRNVLIIIICVILILGAVIAFFFLNRQSNKEKPEQTKIVELDSIKDYGYTLEDRDTELYKGLFKELNTILKEDNIDFEAYANTISKMYIVDLYTIDNKINKYDIGGLEFVLPDTKANFEAKVQDTIYNYMEDNSYKKRTQKLPVVSKIEVTETKEEKVKVKEETCDGYTVNLTWEYHEDMGYDNNAKLNLAKKDNKLYIVKQSVSE